VTFRAVIFDVGGVVVGSPLHAIADYERDHGVPAGFINRVVVETAPHGAWSRLERGELTLDQFYPAFEADCQAGGQAISARLMMERMAAAAGPRPVMLEAVRRIRARGLRAGVITNNWISEDGAMAPLKALFDVFIESAVVGIRKPDPRIFEMTCRELGVEPAQTVFLDDIGLNLKPARAMGMSTIKVNAPEQALNELQTLLGFALLDA
jgi:putative hydrolase of the HAD superfamily